MPRFRIAAIVDPDQLATLLLAARAAGVKLEGLEPVLDGEPSRPSTRRVRKRSTKDGRAKPKKYKPNLRVKMGPEPEGPPRMIQLHRALRRKYGEEPFRKGDVKQAMMATFKGSTTGLMSRLMNEGNVVRA